MHGTNVEQGRGGLVLEAHRFLYHSTLGSRAIKKKKKGRTCAPKYFRGLSFTRFWIDPSPDFRFRVQGAGFRVQGAGFGVHGSMLMVQGSGFSVQGAGYIQGSEFMVQD